MIDYLWIFLTAVVFGFNGIINGLYGKKNSDSNPFIITAISSITIILFFFALNEFKFVYDKDTLIFGLLFGLSFLTTSLFGQLAYRKGSVPLSALFISYSLILPTLYGIIFHRDKTDVLFYVALGFLMISLYLTNKPKKEDGEKTKINLWWLIFVSLAFLGNGFCSIFQTHQQTLVNGKFRSEFMIIGMGVMLIVSVVLYFCKAFGTNGKREISKALPYGFGVGITSALVNFFVMILVSGTVSVSLIFPLISAGSLLVSYLFSALLFKEKLSLVQNLGFVSGLIAVILFNI